MQMNRFYQKKKKKIARDIQYVNQQTLVANKMGIREGLAVTRSGTRF